MRIPRMVYNYHRNCPIRNYNVRTSEESKKNLRIFSVAIMENITPLQFTTILYYLNNSLTRSI